MLDVDTAIDTLATLFEGAPEGAIFLTALGPGGAVHSLAARETDRVEAFLQRHDQAGAGLYFCVGTLLDGGRGRSKSNVGWIIGLHADVDFKDHDCAPEEIRQRIERALLPASLVIETGGGVHSYWLLHEAATATPEMVARVAAASRRLAAAPGGGPQWSRISGRAHIPVTAQC